VSISRVQYARAPRELAHVVCRRALSTFSANLLGDGLRDALDPFSVKQVG
jgi:hypothetical protein